MDHVLHNETSEPGQPRLIGIAELGDIGTFSALRCRFVFTCNRVRL